MTTETTTAAEQPETVSDDLFDKELAADLRRYADQIHERAEKLESEHARIEVAVEKISDADDLLDEGISDRLREGYDRLCRREEELEAKAEQMREAAYKLSEAADLLDGGISDREGSDQGDTGSGNEKETTARPVTMAE